MIDSELIEYFSLLLSFLLSGFYSGSEAALYSISVDRTKQLIEEGGTKGKALEFVAQHSNSVLTTILIGNNLVNIFAASLTTKIAERYFQNDALAISVGLTTMLILIFGEIMPKTFARVRAESIIVFVIKILQINYYLFLPAVKAFCWLIDRVLGENAKLSGRLVTKDEIEFLVSKAEKEKTIDSKQLDLLSSILEFPTIKARDIMIPRSRIKHIKVSSSIEEILEEIKKSNHSRYPVCNEDLDSILGFLHVKDLVLDDVRSQKDFSVKSRLKSPFFVYEHMKIQAIFDHMNRKKVHLAIVKDENGLVTGIITLEDIMEEIVGEIHDEHDLVPPEESGQRAQSKKENGIVVEGKISLRDLYNEYDIKIPLNDHYSTLAGFILDQLGNNFPQTGMIIVWEGYLFKIEKIDGDEIDSVGIRDVEGEKHLYSKTLAEKRSQLDDKKDASG